MPAHITALVLLNADELSDREYEYGNAEDYEKFRIGLSIWDLHSFYLSAIYESRNSVDFYKKLSHRYRPQLQQAH